MDDGKIIMINDEVNKKKCIDMLRKHEGNNKSNDDKF